MNLQKEILLFALILLHIPTKITAWSPNDNQFDRSSFFRKLTNSSLIIGTFLEKKSAVAAEEKEKNEIYEPPPNSQNGKVHIITGASSGLGLESAKRIAAAGATVILTSRTVKKGEQAVDEVKKYLEEKNIENPDVFFLTLNLDDFDSIKSFPERYNTLTSNKRIDCLLNNAGVSGISKRELTIDGFERTFQSNHLGPFVLTALLFPFMNRNNGARVVNVASRNHRFTRNLDLNNLNGERSYVANGWAAYSQSKLENILFTQELQRKADAAGLDWFLTVSLHPGVIGTDIWRSTPVMKKKNMFTSIFYNRMLTTEQGANTQIFLATAREEFLEKGKYYNENRKVQKLKAFANDSVKARELWDISEKLSGIEFQVK